MEEPLVVDCWMPEAPPYLPLSLSTGRGQDSVPHSWDKFRLRGVFVLYHYHGCFNLRNGRGKKWSQPAFSNQAQREKVAKWEARRGSAIGPDSWLVDS